MTGIGCFLVYRDSVPPSRSSDATPRPTRWDRVSGEAPERPARPITHEEAEAFMEEEPENQRITTGQRVEMIEREVRLTQTLVEEIRTEVGAEVGRILNHLTADRNPQDDTPEKPEESRRIQVLKSPGFVGGIVGVLLTTAIMIITYAWIVAPSQEGKADVWVTPEVGTTVEILDSYFGNTFVNEDAAGAIEVQSKVDKHQRICGRYTWSRPKAKMTVSTHVTCVELGPFERKEFWLQWESLEMARTLDCFGNYANNQRGPAGQAAQKELERRNKTAPCLEATPEIIPMPQLSEDDD